MRVRREPGSPRWRRTCAGSPAGSARLGLPPDRADATAAEGVRLSPARLCRSAVLLICRPFRIMCNRVNSAPLCSQSASEPWEDPTGPCQIPQLDRSTIQSLRAPIGNNSRFIGVRTPNNPCGSEGLPYMVRVECPGAARRTSILDAVPRTGRAVARHEHAEQWVDVSVGHPRSSSGSPRSSGQDRAL